MAVEESVQPESLLLLDILHLEVSEHEITEEGAIQEDNHPQLSIHTSSLHKDAVSTPQEAGQLSSESTDAPSLSEAGELLADCTLSITEQAIDNDNDNSTAILSITDQTSGITLNLNTVLAISTGMFCFDFHLSLTVS